MKKQIDGTLNRIGYYDLQALAQIDEASYNSPWDVSQFKALLDDPAIEAWKVSISGVMVAYAFLRWGKRTATIETFTVSPKIRRQGLGTLLASFLTERAIYARMKTLTTDLHESNVKAQEFAKAMGYSAIKILKKHYDDGGDAYFFVKRLDAAQRHDTMKAEEEYKELR